MAGVDDLYVVIPAGGSGTRLWPVSREQSPKFLHALTGTERSLLQATFDRLIGLVPADRVYVVTGTAHAAAVARQLPDVPTENILVEPAPRDSAAAIALACEVIEHRAPGALVGSFAADHLIRDVDGFRRTVRTAVEGARAGQLMTIGITPTSPETGYGYLECVGVPRAGAVMRLASFREKPPADVAATYVASGRYLWNAGMFVWRAPAFLDALARHRPDVAGPIHEIADTWDTPAQESALAGWADVPKVAVDYAVMEPAAAEGLVSTVPSEFDWSDIGDFETVARELGADCDGARVVTGAGNGSSVVAIDSDGVVVVPATGRLVATLGVRDLIVADTDDAVLICRRDRVQDVKRLPDVLRARGATRYI